mgnify:CR=1 FL=1
MNVPPDELRLATVIEPSAVPFVMGLLVLARSTHTSYLVVLIDLEVDPFESQTPIDSRFPPDPLKLTTFALLTISRICIVVVGVFEFEVIFIVLFPETGNVPLPGDRVNADKLTGFRTKAESVNIMVINNFFMAEILWIIYIE